MTYSPGQMYRKGWDDRKSGLPKATGNCPVPSLLEEYNKGYTDCHNEILENEKRTLSQSSPLMGHPLYKEAHEGLNGRVFLSEGN
jgi:hypothetical protein